MGFGNPYGDEWSIAILLKQTEKLIDLGIENIYAADTIGIATPQQIAAVMKNLNGFKNIHFGMHLHSTPNTWEEKIEAAYNNGCRLFDTALKGYGGCPMAKDELTGNIATENLIRYLKFQNEHLELNYDKWREAIEYSVKIFL